MVGITIGPLTFWLTDRAVPFEITSGHIAPPNPAPGEEVEIHWVGYRYRACPGTVERKVIDAWGAPHAIAGADTQYTHSNNPQPVVRTFRLPLSLPPGETTYIATSRFICNWTHHLWPIKVERPHIRFITVKAKAPQGIQGERGPRGERGEQGPTGHSGPPAD